MEDWSSSVCVYIGYVCINSIPSSHSIHFLFLSHFIFLTFHLSISVSGRSSYPWCRISPTRSWIRSYRSSTLLTKLWQDVSVPVTFSLFQSSLTLSFDCSLLLVFPLLQLSQFTSVEEVSRRKSVMCVFQTSKATFTKVLTFTVTNKQKKTKEYPIIIKYQSLHHLFSCLLALYMNQFLQFIYQFSNQSMSSKSYTLCSEHLQ